MINDVRQSQLITWLCQVFSAEKIALIAMNGDAGFRRYFRFHFKNQTYIAVDSPLQWCNNAAFTHIQGLFEQANIEVPKIIAQDGEAGFFCLSDLGDTLLSDVVNLHNMTPYYQQAIDLLPKISSLSCQTLPIFDEKFIQTELNIFTGDIFQIDTPYLDAQSNGLSYLIDRLKNHPLFAHVTLEKGERSELANLANELL